MSTELSLSRDITADPARVWGVLTDLEHAADNLSSVSRVEVLTDGPYRIGTRWRETRSMLGREETQEMTVTESEALGFTRIESTDGDTHYVTTFTLKALHPGTRLTMTFSGGGATEETGTLKKLAAKIVSPVGDRVAKKAVETDLEDIAKAAERR